MITQAKYNELHSEFEELRMEKETALADLEQLQKKYDELGRCFDLQHKRIEEREAFIKESQTKMKDYEDMIIELKAYYRVIITALGILLLTSACYIYGQF